MKTKFIKGNRCKVSGQWVSICQHGKANGWREDQHKPILHCVAGCGATATINWTTGKITENK